MAISHVLTDTTADSATGGNLSVTLPTSIAATDIAILSVGAGRSGAVCGSYTAPAGWTKIGELVNGVNGSSHVTGQVFWALGNVANLTFTVSGTTDEKGYVCAAFRGVDNTTPIDATGTANNTTTNVSSITVNAVTVVTDQAWHLIALADWQGGTFSATSFTNSQNGASNIGVTVMYNTTPKGTGSTGTVSVSSSGSTSGQVLTAVPFALMPSGGAAAGQPTAKRMGGILHAANNAQRCRGVTSWRQIGKLFLPQFA
jgi:hypothetical protein